VINATLSESIVSCAVWKIVTPVYNEFSSVTVNVIVQPG